MAFKYTEDQLNKMDKTLLIELFLGLQDQMEDLTKETHALNEKIVFFNEAEAVSDPEIEEPEELELQKISRRKKGKKDQDLSGIPVRRIDHYLTE